MLAEMDDAAPDGTNRTQQAIMGEALSYDLAFAAILLCGELQCGKSGVGNLCVGGGLKI